MKHILRIFFAVALMMAAAPVQTQAQSFWKQLLNGVAQGLNMTANALREQQQQQYRQQQQSRQQKLTSDQVQQKAAALGIGNYNVNSTYVDPNIFDSSTSTSSSSQSTTTSTSTYKERVVCHVCGGRGKCPTCPGDGLYLPYVGAKKKVTCPTCNGTGHCKYCNGTGYK